MPESIDRPSLTYTEQKTENDWELIRDLLGGTRAMREGTTRWLPKEGGEDHDQYLNRLQRTFLYNGFERCLLRNAGKIFASPVLLGEHTDPGIRRWCEDIDLAGQRLTPFARNLYQTGSAYGIAHVLVDYPRSPARTLAEKKALGHRPYVIEISPFDLFHCEFQPVDGVTTLSEIRFFRHGVRSNRMGLQEKAVDIIVYRSNEFLRYEKTERGEYEVVERGPVSLGKIPLVTLYFNRVGWMKARPPYLTLAYLNLAHWQSYSDYRNYLRLCGMPTPCFAGFGTGESAEIPMGPNIARETDNIQAKAWYMEVASGSDNALRNGLQHLEQQMEIMGTALTMGQAWQMTATEKVINTVESDNFVSMSARALQVGLQQILEWMALWEGQDPRTALSGVVVNDDFGLLFGNEGELQEWSKARDRGDITQKTYLEGLRKRGMLDEDFDIEAEVEASRLEKQMDNALNPEMFPASQEESEES